MNPPLPPLVSVPAGRFTLGLPPCPPRANFAWIWHSGKSVDVAPFQLGQHHVTNAEYRVFLQDTARARPPCIDQAGFSDDRQPVVGVSWDDAMAYCEWLRRHTGRAYRLPGDSEWEYAARGGRLDSIFPWGDALDPVFASFGGQRGPRPVLSYPPNGFGLHDMIGNAWQWCHDRYEDVSGGVKAVNRPTGRDPAGNRVVRGGSFQTCHYLNLWLAYRHEDPPDLRHESIGFRVAL